MFSDPNINSPANIDAAKEWRDDREAYTLRVLETVAASQAHLSAAERKAFESASGSNSNNNNNNNNNNNGSSSSNKKTSAMSSSSSSSSAKKKNKKKK